MKKELTKMPWVPPYEKRKEFPRKVRDIEKEINSHKLVGNWEEASKLQRKLRNSWWGYKRYF
jgi:hypothetical protein